MTPTKALLAATLALAVLAAGCAGNGDGNEATEGQNASDENADLYTGEEAPQPGENVPGDGGNATTNETGDASGSAGTGTSG